MTEVLSACFTTLNGWNLPHQLKKPMSTLGIKLDQSHSKMHDTGYNLTHHSINTKKEKYVLSPHNYVPFIQTNNSSPGFFHIPICLPTIKEAKNNIDAISSLSSRKYILNKRGSSLLNYQNIKNLNSQNGHFSRLFENIEKRKALMKLSVLRKTSSCIGICNKDTLLRTMRQPKWSVPGKGL